MGIGAGIRKGPPRKRNICDPQYRQIKVYLSCGGVIVVVAVHL